MTWNTKQSTTLNQLIVFPVNALSSPKKFPVFRFVNFCLATLYLHQYYIDPLLTPYPFTSNVVHLGIYTHTQAQPPPMISEIEDGW